MSDKPMKVRGLQPEGTLSGFAEEQQKYREQVDSLEQQLPRVRTRMRDHERRFVKIERDIRLLRDKRRWWQVWK